MYAGNIGEYGCLQSHHCTGGAVCYQRRCVCPDGYMQIASGTKCARRGGTYNVNRNLAHSSDETEVDANKLMTKSLYCTEWPSH